MTTQARHRERLSCDENHTMTRTRNGVFNYSTTCSKCYENEVIDDFVTDNFRTRIAEGEIINNPCTYATEYRKSSEGYLKLEMPGDILESTGGSQTYFHASLGDGIIANNTPAYVKLLGLHPDVTTVTADIGSAKQKAIANIDATPFEFGEDLFEIGETLRFLKSPGSSLARLAKSFKTKKDRALKKSPRRLRENIHARTKLINDVWLEYRFAAAPLLRSSLDAIAAISTSKPVLPVRMTARGFEEESNIKFDFPTHWWSSSNTSYFQRKSEANSKVHAAILYEVINPVNDWRYKLGLRNKDIPFVMWQVVPLSFMVDRVYNISNVIRGFTNLLDPSVRILAASTTTRTLSEFTLRMIDEVNGSYTVTLRGDDYIKGNFTYDRVPWSPSVSDLFPPKISDRLIADAVNVSDLFALTYNRLL